MAVILLAYWLVADNRLSGFSYTYFILGLFGAITLTATAYAGKVYPHAVLNAVFGLIAIHGMLKVRKQRGG